MASTGSKGNRQSLCFGYLVVFHALTPTNAFGVRPQALIFAFDTPLKRLFDRLRSTVSRADGPSTLFQHPRQPSAGHAITGVAIFFLHFFSRLFVDRNAMVVSLQREKVTGKPPYLHPNSNGEPPQVIKFGRTCGEPPLPANRRRWRGTPAGEKTGNLRGYESSRLDAAFARRRHKKRN